MKTAWAWTQAGISGLGGFLGWFFGGFDGFIYALIAFTVVDYITGVMCAVVKKELSSEVGARGICKKLLIFLIVGIGHLIDGYLLGNAGSPCGSTALRTALIFFYLSNEGISLVENAAVVGVPIPKPLKDALVQLNRKSGSEKEEK
jgi:toxin secretion/phage lysis holin